MARLMIVAIGAAMAFLIAGASARAAEKVFAATGLSKNTDVMTAAEEATKAMMAKFEAAGRKPGAVIFLERVAKSGNKRAAQIGGKVKELAGGVPTFGHGGTDVYGLTWGADVKDNDSTFLVMGLDAPNLSVKGYAVGGHIDYSYASEGKKTGQSDEQYQAALAQEKVQRATATARGKELGAMIPKLEKPGFVIFMAALHNNWHVTFLEGVRQAVGNGVPIVGGVGKWEDYVYNDGGSLTDAQGKPTTVGQMAVVVQADMKISLAGAFCTDTSKPAVVDQTMQSVMAKSLAGLDGGKPDAVIAFSCVTLLRDSKTMDPAVFYKKLQASYGENAPIFGCFCGGEAGTLNDGKFGAGGSHFTVAVMGDR